MVYCQKFITEVSKFNNGPLKLMLLNQAEEVLKGLGQEKVNAELIAKLLQKIEEQKKSIGDVEPAVFQGVTSEFARCFNNLKDLSDVLEDAPPRIADLESGLVVEILSSSTFKKEEALFDSPLIRH